MTSPTTIKFSPEVRDRAVRMRPPQRGHGGLTGNPVVDYASADEFLQRGDLNRVSGLILDHHIAHVSGLELAAWLRAGGGSWPFCWSTGAPSPAIAARVAELDITKELEKPSAEADIMAFIDGAGG
jgi:FixJ family two-component response regulator